MMYTDAIQAANSLVSIVPLRGGNASRKDYEDALTLVEYLVEHEPDHPLVDMLVAKIAQYEDEAEEFAEFNDRIAALPSGVALLRVLMDQHKLTQSDFEEEIGKKSLVSRILNGTRSLTLDHMKALARRFNIPPSSVMDA